MEEENFYEARLDKIFANGSMWNHRTFRTILDPYSNEWNSTDYDKKVAILEKFIASGESLHLLISDYKQRYDKQNRKDISSCVEDALIILLEYQLTK